MKRKDKKADDCLRRLLQMNAIPEPEGGKRRTLINRLTAEAMNMDYLEQESFIERILTLGSYFSPWVWVAQAVIPALFFLCAFREQELVLPYLCALAPGLTLIILSELSKTFGNNMWEMEAVCRYNLPQIFFLRLTLLSGIDLLTLAATLAAFRMTGGKLWQFAVYALLPFFLLSSLCLWLLRHFGSRCSRMGLCGVLIILELLWIPSYQLFQKIGLRFGEAAMERLVLCATVLSLLFFIGSSAALCTKKYYGKYEDNMIWNLE